MVKVFYWDVVRCLESAFAGCAIGIGNTKEDVIEAIVSDAFSWEAAYWSEVEKEHWCDKLREELRAKKPRVFDSFPVGIAIEGCD